jgi:hypothetical protein
MEITIKYKKNEQPSVFEAKTDGSLTDFKVKDLAADRLKDIEVELTLKEDEDTSEFDIVRQAQVALMGENLIRALWDFDQKLRNKVKYANPDLDNYSEDVIEALDNCRTMLREALTDNGCSLEIVFE